MPMPSWSGLHDALVPHWSSAAFWSQIGRDGEQMSAQYLLFGCDASWSAHCGFAVTPAGMSVGHGLKRPHLGVQKSPWTPWIVTSSSSERQPPFGSS